MEKTRIGGIRTRSALAFGLLLAVPLQLESTPGYGGELPLRWHDIALVAILALLVSLRTDVEPDALTVGLVGGATALVLASVVTAGSDPTSVVAGFRVIAGLWLALLVATRLRRSEADALPLVLAVAGTGAAILGLVWLRWPPATSIDSAFVGSATPFIYHDRLTRPFAHANTAAAFFVTTAVATVWVLARQERTPTLRRLAIAAGLATQLAALLLTLSRGAGIALAAVCLLGLIPVFGRSVRPARTLLVATLLTATVLLATSQGFRARIIPGAAKDEARVAIEAPAQFDATSNPTITIINNSSLTLPASGSRSTSILGVWFDEAGVQQLAVDRWPIPEPIRPGETAELAIAILPPVPVGAYRVEWDVRLGSAADLGAWGATTSASTVDVSSSTVTGVSPSFPVVSPSRPAIWSSAWRIFLRHPILGIGPGNLPRGWAEVNSPTSTPVNHAHNQPLEWLATLGLPAALVLVALLAVALTRARRVNAAGDPTAGFAFAAIVALVVAGLVDTPLAAPPLNVVWWVVVGLGLRIGSEATEC